MADCDLCGKESKLVEAVVEGALLNVCEACARFGNVVPIKKLPKRVMKQEKEDLREIVQDFNIKIKRAREKFGMMQEDVARRLNEKLSVIQKIERGEIKPSIELARKIERFFRINLIEDTSGYREEPKMNLRDSRLTVGDLVKMRDRKI